VRARYLIFSTQARRGGNREKLMSNIDDCVGEIAGDRTRLHAKNHRCELQIIEAAS
jgi:hypothetical protein